MEKITLQDSQPVVRCYYLGMPCEERGAAPLGVLGFMAQLWSIWEGCWQCTAGHSCRVWHLPPIQVRTCSDGAHCTAIGVTGVSE